MNQKFLSVLLCAVVMLFSCKKDFEQSSPELSDSEGKNESAKISAGTFYVSAGSTGADDPARSGTDPAKPWKTIQYAVGRLPVSSTLIIYGGTYYGNVNVPSTCNGTSTAPTIIKGADNATVTLQGNISSGSVYEGLFRLAGVQYVKVQRINVKDAYFFGFFVDGGSNVTIERCSSFNTRASGIYVGNSAYVSVLNNVVKQACKWSDRTASGIGSQECISIVTSNNFKVYDNEVADVTNIGSGGEGIDAKLGSSNGEIRGNNVHDLVRLGIYVDAGGRTRVSSNIRIHKNKVNRTSGGITMAAENGGIVDKVYIYNNVISNSKAYGVSLSNYATDTLYKPTLKNIYITNNTFYNNVTTDKTSGDIASYNSSPNSGNFVIKNNIFYDMGPYYDWTIYHNKKSLHTISNNSFYNFKASTNSPNSFTTTDASANNNLNNTNPLFSDAANGNFYLQSTSPVRNKGVLIYAVGVTGLLYTDDIFWNNRGSVWDLGAYEYL